MGRVVGGGRQALDEALWRRLKVHLLVLLRMVMLMVMLVLSGIDASGARRRHRVGLIVVIVRGLLLLLLISGRLFASLRVGGGEAGRRVLLRVAERRAPHRVQGRRVERSCGGGRGVTAHHLGLR